MENSIVDQTHPVIPSGKLLLPKMISCQKDAFNVTKFAGPWGVPKFRPILSALEDFKKSPILVLRESN